MKKNIYAVYGASGFGREVMPLARNQLRREGKSGDLLVFIDDDPKFDEINGHQVLTYAEFMTIEAEAYNIAIAIAACGLRERIAERINSQNTTLWQIAADNIVVLDQVTVGSGAILCAYVCLTSNIKIGHCFHANIYSYVAHDCQIGDFVTFAPGVKCNGNVIVEDKVYIGAGAVIKQGQPQNPIVIGANSIIGMGAVVTKNVKAGSTVVGIPARLK